MVYRTPEAIKNMAILKKDILELIDQKLVRARSQWEEYHKLAPNAY